MYILNLLFLVIFPVTNMIQVVEEFHDLKSKELEQNFIQKYEQCFEPTILGYRYAVEMKQAEYSYNPITKLKVFNTAKNKINSLIEQNPNNVHLRYVRLVLQEKAPSILGYNDFLEEDKTFLKNRLKLEDESDHLDSFIQKNTSL